jgi:DNA-binding winged helix-turn-helix (wHTH) protein
VSLGFGDCRLDIDARRLFRGQREVPISPKAFELLKFLVETRPRALSKAELLERVWRDVYVSDAALARVINQVRRAVGDSARRPRIVRTVHAYGYAFVGEVVDAAVADAVPAREPRAEYWLVVGRRKFPLADGEHIIGRDPDVAVWLDSPKVSRRHARIVVGDGRVTIEDLGSKNGTIVSGRKIQSPAGLAPGDRIQVGPFALSFRAGSESRSTETGY